MPALLIFDCDGTLIDSERLYNLAWVEVLGRYGLPWTTDDCARRLMGRTLPDCYAIVAQAMGRDSLPDDFEDEVFAASDRVFAREGLQVIDGVREALAALPHAKCIASSGVYEHVRDNLAQTGLLAHFGVERIFTASMVARGKPAPDVFLHAARRMGAAPQDCIVIEDSVPGVLGGRAAGMRVLGYGGNHHDPVALRAAGAEVFDDMRALPALIG
ncbi:MAG: HAD family phosphatase [Alphaproteobacteria bacterium]|nr:HAD family phosphatase [Alphaproteobacteria bacterium]